MNSLLRLLIFGGLAACVVVLVILGLAQHNADLRAPFDLFLFAVAVAVYFLPTALAVYRDSHATPWIAVVNTLLGWTILGWFVTLGWAAAGRADALPPRPHIPSGNHVTGHS
jgi:RsiW-degrading membrane proteinase PrsW (M82 family)